MEFVDNRVFRADKYVRRLALPVHGYRLFPRSFELNSNALLIESKDMFANSNFKSLLVGSMFLGGVLALGCSPEQSAAVQIQTATPDAGVRATTTEASTEDTTASTANATQTSSSGGATPDAAAKKPSTSGMAGMKGMAKMKFPAPKDMKFKDELESNVEAPKDISELVFTNKDGSKIKLADYLGKQNVILVFTEGFNGMLCPFCKTQTSRLVANYEKFQDRDCEVIVVYPGAEDHLDEFVEAALKTEKEQVDEVPFPIVLDKDFKATDFFDIHSMHAHPSTYLIDKQGNVKFAYVGNDMTADRPSVKALLGRLDNLK